MSDLNKPEPPPLPGSGDSVWGMVIRDVAEMAKVYDFAAVRSVLDDMRARDEFGRKKYGTPLQADNGRDFLVDAYQEQLDFIVYLRGDLENNPDDVVLATYRAAISTAMWLRALIAKRQGGEA